MLPLSLVEITNVTAVKSGNTLFQNFNWRIKEGEHWFITGANGAGKTVLLEMLAGIVNAPHGEINFNFIEGNSWEDRYWDRRRKIKFIPAHAVQSLVKNSPDVYYQQRYYGSDEENVFRVRDILGDDLNNLDALHIPSSFSIEHLLDVEVTRLSNGQLKKILLVQSLVTHRPRMLLLDYPFEGLDHVSREELSHFIDFIATTYNVQIILVDQHHHLPSVMNRKLTLDQFKITGQETIEPGHTGLTDFKIHAGSSSLSIPVVEMKDLTIQYGDTIIIKDFNWRIHQGER